MNESKKPEEFQIVRVTEAHDCDGVFLTKGMFGYVCPKDAAGPLNDNEIAVSFTSVDRTFLKVDRSKIEVFTGDLATVAARALGYEKLEFRLRDIQQKWHNRENEKMVQTVLELRKTFHVKSMKAILGWSTSEAIADFLKEEAILESLKTKPYKTTASK